MKGKLGVPDSSRSFPFGAVEEHLLAVEESDPDHISVSENLSWHRNNVLVLLLTI